MKDDLLTVPLLAEGVDGLREHNLFTFKSYQEPFDHEAIEELIAYFNLYLKTKAPQTKNELDRSLVRLFAICVRKPNALLKNPKIPTNEIDNGVYDVEYGVTQFRLIVVNELELCTENANLLLFSNLKDRVEYGKKKHSLGQTRYTNLMKQLLTRYENEGDQEMVDILNPTEEELFEDLADTPRTRKKLIKIFKKKEYLPEVLEEIPEEERLKGITPEKRLEGISVEDRLKGLSPEQLAELTRLAAERAKQPPENPS